MNLISRSDVQVRLRTLTGRPTPDRRSWVIRPDDLLVLDFELVNLTVQPGEGESPARLAKSGTGPAYLVVTFPPQHLAEIAYFTTDPRYPVANGLPTILTRRGATSHRTRRRSRRSCRAGRGLCSACRTIVSP